MIQTKSATHSQNDSSGHAQRLKRECYLRRCLSRGFRASDGPVALDAAVVTLRFISLTCIAGRRFRHSRRHGTLFAE